jgi:aminoglycoside phosphotransferase
MHPKVSNNQFKQYGFSDKEKDKPMAPHFRQKKLSMNKIVQVSKHSNNKFWKKKKLIGKESTHIRRQLTHE